MRSLVLIAFPLTLVLPACGWFPGPPSPSPPHTALGRPACSVEVYFVTSATHTQVK